MTLDQLIAVGVGVGAAKMREWLAGEGVTVPDELLHLVETVMRQLLRARPGVTHAQALVVEDEREPPHS